MPTSDPPSGRRKPGNSWKNCFEKFLRFLARGRCNVPPQAVKAMKRTIEAAVSASAGGPQYLELDAILFRRLADNVVGLGLGQASAFLAALVGDPLSCPN